MKPLFFLSTLAIKNFKAVRSSGTVKLSPLTVFIGNNGSGKSSLLEGLETYQETVTHGLDTAMRRWPGFESVWNKRVRHQRRNIGSVDETYENPLAFVLKGHVFDGVFTARMAISADPGTDGMRIESEFLKLPSGCLIQRDRHGNTSIHGSPACERQVQFHPSESATPREFGAMVASWQFLSFAPEYMHRPVRQTMPPGPCKLHRDGSNLGQYLWEIRQRDVTAFAGILEALRFVLPFASDIQPRVTRRWNVWCICR